MLLLSRKGILAITAVVDIAVHSKGHPIPAKALTARHRLSPRHLEPLLQALVHDGILKGVRGPNGGYRLGRAAGLITASDVLRATSRATGEHGAATASALLRLVVQPALAEAERMFSLALGRISIEDMARRAEALK